MVALHDNKPRNNIRRPSGSRCRRGYGRILLHRLVAAGADVTARSSTIPCWCGADCDSGSEARWVGGIAHALPFASCSFDIVCCNAALHHMRDTATSLEEMLRVLKPGGWLITTGDPYRASHLGEDHELSVFDRHPGVLLGVNESIPSFTAFELVLARYRDRLDIKLITGRCIPLCPPLPGRLARRSFELPPRPSAGSLAVLVSPKSATGPVTLTMPCVRSGGTSIEIASSSVAAAAQSRSAAMCASRSSSRRAARKKRYRSAGVYA